MLNEFKAFIAKGNVLDLAVGIIIGAAFTAIVTSLVDDLIQPLIGLIIGGIDFSSWGFSIGDAKFAIGNFITAIINFLIVAWVVFLVVKAINRMSQLNKNPEVPGPPPAPSAEEKLLAEIRDLLAEQSAK